MADFKEGEYIIYRNGERYELGRIKRITENGAFVWYSDGETAAKTPFDCMHKIVNGYAIKETSLGGEGMRCVRNATTKYPSDDFEISGLR